MNTSSGMSAGCCLGSRGGKNVGESERNASLIGGTALCMAGLSMRSRLGLILACIGGSMLYRGTTGHCSLYSALGVNTNEGSTHGFLPASVVEQSMPKKDNVVDEASWESFPASDPPSWNAGASS